MALIDDEILKYKDITLIRLKNNKTLRKKQFDY